MFLLSLIIFPVIAYYLFNIFKSDGESNGAVKLIGIIGLLLLVTVITFDIFGNRESYLALVLVWYIGVFLYYYVQHVKLQLQNIDNLKFGKLSISESLLKLSFLILIFILFINVLEDRDVTRSLNIFRYDSQGLLNLVFLFMVSSLLFGLLYEVVDVVKNNILRKMIDSRDSKEKLKKELKSELLKELKG